MTFLSQTWAGQGKHEQVYTSRTYGISMPDRAVSQGYLYGQRALYIRMLGPSWQDIMHRISDGDNNMTAHGLICAHRLQMKASFSISHRALEDQTSCICTAIHLPWVSNPKRRLSCHNLSNADTTADSVQFLSSDRLTAEHKLSASCADLACSDTKKICVCL